VDQRAFGEGSFTGDPEKYVKALEWVSVSTGGPLLGNMEGSSFLKAFEINKYIKRYEKMPCKRVSLSTWVPLWNTEGIHLPGHFERKRKYIWVPFLGPVGNKILSLVTI
jgi:hypothetical protein